MVLEFLITSLKVATDLDAISNPIQPAGILLLSTICVFASAENLSAITLSVGINNLTPFAAAFSSN